MEKYQNENEDGEQVYRDQRLETGIVPLIPV